MSYTSNYNLNQRVSYLESIIQGLTPYLPINLANTLLGGNSAGASDIDLNNNDILQVNNIDLVTVNGTAYPPPSTPSSSVFNFKAHTNSQAPPVPSGDIEWNNVNQLLATQIYVSHLDDDGDDIQVLLSALPLGTIFIIQDQAIGSNYQRWTITSVSQVINQYITFGVSLLASTHSFSNNDPILFITLSANQNLEQVLAVGNSAGIYDINLNNNDLLNVANITGSSSSGVDLNISSTNNITMSADNIDIGTTEIIYPTLATPARVRIKASGQVVVDNNNGGTATPAVVLNQVALAGGALVEEVYNQRTATTGEFNRMSFFSKTSTGVKSEYARISQNAQAITNGSERGRIDFAVRDITGVTDYLSLRGSSFDVNVFRALNLNNNNIGNCSTAAISLLNNVTINTSLINSTITPLIYYPSINEIVTTPTYTLPTLSTPTKHSLFLYNNGIPPALTTSSKSPAPNGFCQSSPSIQFSGYTILADSNTMYYWDTFSNSWSSFYSFNGVVRAMAIGDDGYLWVGGEFTADTSFTQTFNYIAKFSSGLSPFSINWGNVSGTGFNSPVRTLCNNGAANGYIYAGGIFTFNDGNTLQLNYFACINVFNTDLYPIDNNTGCGFNSPVNTISTLGSNVLVGGEFSFATADYLNLGSTSFNYPYCIIWNSSGFQSNNGTGNEMIYIGSNAFSINSNVITSAINTDVSVVWVGGGFFNVDGSGENYIFGVDPNNPSTIISTGYSVSNNCNSIRGSTGFSGNNAVFAVVQSTWEILLLRPANTIQIAIGPFGSEIVGAEYDFGNGTIDLFFSASSTILSYNPAQSIFINLFSQGFEFIVNGVTYSNSCNISGPNSFIQGEFLIRTPPTYLITNSYNATFS